MLTIMLRAFPSADNQIHNEGVIAAHQSNRNQTYDLENNNRSIDPNDPHSCRGNDDSIAHNISSIVTASDVVSEPLHSSSTVMATVIHNNNAIIDNPSTIADQAVERTPTVAVLSVADATPSENATCIHGTSQDHSDIVQAEEMPIAVANAIPSYWSAIQPHAIPLPAPRPQQADDGDIYERERILLNLYHRSRFIRLMALIDLCFLILFGAFVEIVFIGVIFPVIGYWGARRWKYRLLFIYATFLFLEVVGNFAVIVFAFDAAFLILHIMHIFIALVLARYTLNLANYILVMNAADLDFLKNSTLIRNIEKRAIC